MIEAAMVVHAFGQHFLPRMPKRGMSQIVRQRDGFREIFVEPECSRDRPANRRDLDGMGQAGTQMVACPIQKNLRLVFHPSKRTRMDNAGAIALKFCAIGVSRLRVFPSARFPRFFRKRRKHCALGCFHFFPSFAVGGAHDVDLDLSTVSRNSRCAFRPLSRATSKSKMARTIAVNVSHAQINQNKMNQAGCSRGSSADCKKVDPKNKKMSATISRTDIVLRRVLRSRIIPRVAETIREGAFCAFPGDEFFDTTD
jgi:hypothetical protein